MPLDQLLEGITTALDGAASVTEACQRAVEAFVRRTPAMIAVLLPVQENLRCVAAAGSWRVYSSLPMGTGIAGEVYRTGRTATVSALPPVRDQVRLGPVVAAEICAPIPLADGRTGGVLDVEWTAEVDVPRWRPVVEAVAARIGTRVAALGGPPNESATERLLRHALAFGTAADERQLLHRSLVAAREVSGLSTPAVLLPGRTGARALLDAARPTRLGERLAGLGPEVLGQFTVQARRYGAAYTAGDPAEFGDHGFDQLTSIGVGTMISVPVGPGRNAAADERSAGAVLLAVDERVIRPDPAVPNLLELLAAHAWTSLDRLETLRRLAEKASSDPLTGLRHYGSFGERLAGAMPGRTALLAIDVDRFKQLNDEYGHQAGDRALVQLARSLLGALRSEDELYRIGGDEFAAVVEVRTAAEARAIADRLVHAARSAGRTISVGVALRTADESATDTLHRADLALYEAKRAGRDRVRVAPGDRVAGAA